MTVDSSDTPESFRTERSCYLDHKTMASEMYNVVYFVVFLLRKVFHS